MIQAMEHKVENSHRPSFLYDPALSGFSHLQLRPLHDLSEWIEYFRDDKFRSAEKYIHFSE